jgi:hypothetical protein
MKRRTFIAGVGSAAAWPVVARAQQVPVIGYLGSRIPIGAPAGTITVGIRRIAADTIPPCVHAPLSYMK